MTLWGANRNSPTTRDSFPRFNVTGPDVPLSGNITRIWVLVHSRIGAGTPLKSTVSWPGFLWPNPRPEITTGLPIGPTVGSRVIGIITVKVTRSEEHTSELQSRLHLVCRLLLEKKKQH